MKKALFAFAAVSVLLLLAGCSGKEKQNSSSTSVSENQVQTQNSDAKTESKNNAKKRDSIVSVVLYDETPLYTENSDGKMIYATALMLGETLNLYVNGTSPVQKMAIRRLSNGDEKELSFVQVSYEDVDYWTRDIFVTKYPSVKAGVILEDTLIYENPEGSGATSKKLEAYSIVAVDPAKIVTDEDIGLSFVPVVYYTGTAYGREVYVKEEAISKSDYDVIALQTVAAAKKFKTLKPEVVIQLRDCLERLSISEALDEYVSTAF